MSDSAVPRRPEELTAVIDDCPCLVRHRTAAWIDTHLRQLVELAGPTVLVRDDAGGCWRVPRVYIAMHGVIPEQLSYIAVVYGFERVADDVR